MTAPDPFALDLEIMREIDGTVLLPSQLTWHSSAPSSPSVGDIYADTASSQLYIWNDGGWMTLVTELDP